MDMSEIKKRREAANKRQRDMIRKRNEILAKSKAEIRSFIIRPVKAFNLSGLFKVIVKMLSLTSYFIVSNFINYPSYLIQFRDLLLLLVFHHLLLLLF